MKVEVIQKAVFQIQPGNYTTPFTQAPAIIFVGGMVKFKSELPLSEQHAATINAHAERIEKEK